MGLEASRCDRMREHPGDVVGLVGGHGFAVEEDGVPSCGCVVTSPRDAPAVAVDVAVVEELGQIVVHDDGTSRVDREELAHDPSPPQR